MDRRIGNQHTQQAGRLVWRGRPVQAVMLSRAAMKMRGIDRGAITASSMIGGKRKYAAMTKMCADSSMKASPSTKHSIKWAAEKDA